MMNVETAAIVFGRLRRILNDLSPDWNAHIELMNVTETDVGYLIELPVSNAAGTKTIIKSVSAFKFEDGN